jgi:hypothetical protein
MGRIFLPSISLALTCYSDSRARNVSFKRISSDQFRLLQAGSMDVSGDQEHHRTHLRDLLTSSARSVVSPVRGSESGGVFRPHKYQKEGLGTSFTCNSETRHSKNFASLPQAYPSTPKPSVRQHQGFAGIQKLILLFGAAAAIPTCAFDFEKVRPTLKMVLDSFKDLE